MLRCIYAQDADDGHAGGGRLPCNREEALRRDLGLDALDQLWAKVKPAPEEEGMELGTTELHAMRQKKRAASGS